MKLENNPKKYQKPSDKPKHTIPGTTIRGKFIPYTWIIMGVGAVITVLSMFFIFFGTNTGQRAENAQEPSTENVETVEPSDDAEVEDTVTETDTAEDSGDGRMWDEYIDDSDSSDNAESASSDEASDEASEESSEEASSETSEESSEEAASEPVDNEAMVETITQFLVAYQIYGPETTAQDRYDAMLKYGSETVANELIPTRGVDEAQSSIDVKNELVKIDVVPNEGVENEYTVTMTYTAEVMGQVGQYTDVYTIRTDGSQVTEAIVRSMTTDN